MLLMRGENPRLISCASAVGVAEDMDIDCHDSLAISSPADLLVLEY
jgi:hypothetical protein